MQRAGRGVLGACDRSSVPLPERKTTPSSERRSESPTAPSTRHAAGVPAIPPDTATGKAIGDAASAPARHAALSAFVQTVGVEDHQAAIE